jgi:FMN phosphatase YigB (HAD superfamily)
MNSGEGSRSVLKALLLVDYGGVIAEHHCDPAESNLATLLGVDRERSRELLSERSNQGAAFREGRISEREFWDRVLLLAGKSLADRPDDSVLSTLWAQTYRVKRDAIELIQRVRQIAPVGILTNIDCARSAYIESVVEISKYIDIYFPSYLYHAIKPASELWKSVDASARRKFGRDLRIIYVDDRERHVQASREAGWDSIMYHGINTLQRELACRGLFCERPADPLFSIEE